MKQLRGRFDLSDGLYFGGLILLGGGIWWWQGPAVALVIVGGLAAATGLLMAWMPFVRRRRG